MDEEKYTDAAGLIKVLFSDDARPSVRWVRDQQKRRAIPFIKIGRLVFFDPPRVREALAKRNLVTARL
jgi:hypothetical protein